MNVDVLLLALRFLLALSLYLFIAAILVFLWRDLRSASLYTQMIPVAYLVLDEAKAEASRFKLLEENIIGRAPDNSIPVNDETVSTRHARLAFYKGQWWLEDLGSRNGTRVNDIRVEDPLVLADGDRIHVGKVATRFELGQPNPQSK